MAKKKKRKSVAKEEVMIDLTTEAPGVGEVVETDPRSDSALAWVSGLQDKSLAAKQRILTPFKSLRQDPDGSDEQFWQGFDKGLEMGEKQTLTRVARAGLFELYRLRKSARRAMGL